ncbi:MAG TPA: ImmA/IrrE family metallo-endopeptidase [Thermoanaerobaculaceae bacterium]|nr:ImmA/IrrE family metallo-endopeptidase [Thermoanaerobaculaceae bacterium]
MAPRYALAKRKAQQLLEQAGITKPPVRVETLAKHVGARVRHEPFSGEGLSGMAYRQPDGRLFIGVNALHPRTRRRFTIAHEIAHLILHQHEDLHIDEAFVIELRNDRSSMAVDEKEIEANQFAAELLMPAAWLRDDLHDRRIDLESDNEAIAELAAKYQVSVQAMTIRLSALGAVRG